MWKVIHNSVFPGLIAGLLLTLNSCDSKKGHPKIFWEKSQSPTLIGRLVVNDLLSKPGLMMYRSEHLNTVHYAEACAGMGAVRLAHQLKDSVMFNQLTERYQDLFNHFDTLPANHVDANVLGILPLEFYLCSSEERYLKKGIVMADKQWDSQRSDGLTNQTRFWIDDIFMIGSLQILAYKATGDTIYIQRAAREIEAYLKKLQQPNGLFFHGENAPFFWGRGNGWVAVGLANLVAALPTDNEYYPLVLKGYRKMMEALVRYQAADGMWRQLVDQDESWEESSATAMFGYAIKVGVDKGLLSGEKYSAAYRKAWLALANRVGKDGKLTDICVGTGQSTDIRYYLNRPKTTGDLHGQAPVLWFASSLLTDSLSGD